MSCGNSLLRRFRLQKIDLLPKILPVVASNRPVEYGLAEVLGDSAAEIRRELYSVGKEFSRAAKEFCRLAEEFGRVGKESGRLTKESG
ncbi:hypothetical protein [Candidatus Electronema sp. PJ]|uniref:hypothetical protein n=1 Tax=Candidatus Electronema sp. PJ TaxID=3401572 RepID=UPI003AA854D0